MNKNIESLVMTTSRSIKINEAYQAEIKKMEDFINTIELKPDLTDSEKECIAQSKIKINELKVFVANHKNQIKQHLEDNNLGMIYNVAEIFNDFIK